MSVLKKENTEALNSVVQRPSYSPLLIAMKWLISPPKKATAQNVEHKFTMLFNSERDAKVLIIGGGTVGLRMESFCNDPRILLVSFDIYASPSVQFLADAHSVPSPDNFFDAVVIQAVLEHVLEPITVVSKIHRVLKQDRIVCAERPFLQRVHEGPFEFTRFTESGPRKLVKDSALLVNMPMRVCRYLFIIIFYFKSKFWGQIINALAEYQILPSTIKTRNKMSSTVRCL